MFLQKQLEWFANITLNIPNDEWSVAVCSHANSLGLSHEERMYNYTVMECVLSAFYRRGVYDGEEKHENPLFNVKISVDYTKKGGTVIAWLGGHDHVDGCAVKNGIALVETETDAMYCA